MLAPLWLLCNCFDLFHPQNNAMYFIDEKDKEPRSMPILFYSVDQNELEKLAICLQIQAIQLTYKENTL